MTKNVSVKQNQLSPCSPYDLRAVTDIENNTFLIQTSLIISARNNMMNSDRTIVELITGESLDINMKVNAFIDALNLKYPYGIKAQG